MERQVPMRQVLWLTQRGERHQQAALRAAPPQLQVTILRNAAEAQLAQAEILVSERSGAITTAMLDRAPQLKLIVRLGSLAHDIDLAACAARGITVVCQPVQISILAAEHLVMMMLALIKRLGAAQAALLNQPTSQAARRTDENTFSYNWQRLENIGSLSEKIIAIVGMGEIGVETARRLRPFLPAEILYHKRAPFPPRVESELGIRYAPCEVCYSSADVLVALLPYAAETDLSLNRAVFDQMKRGALLVHAGSGGTIHETDLLAALHTGQLGGAALDTFEYEPLPSDHPLIGYARQPDHNLILTPHIAAGSSIPNRREDYAEIERFLAGEPLRYRLV